MTYIYICTIIVLKYDVHKNAFRFPREWIKGDGYPDGIGRNDELSERDKEHVKRLYGPSRLPGAPSTGGGSRGGRRTTVTPIIPVAPERRKPVTSLPPPTGNTIHDVQAYEPHRGMHILHIHAILLQFRSNFLI